MSVKGAIIIQILTTALLTILIVTILLISQKGLRKVVPIWKSTRRAFLGIHSGGSDNDPVIIHYASPRIELEIMRQSTLYLYETFRDKHVEKVRGLIHLGAFPMLHPICVIAKDQKGGEIFIMLRGRRYVEENELFKTWRQAEIYIGDRNFHVFEGFVVVFNQIELEVKRILLAHKGRVHIVGHSLGAGVGVMLAVSLHLAFPGRIASVVLLANTRVSAPALAEFIQHDHPQLWDKIWRVVNECDPFVQLPLSYMPSLSNEYYDPVVYAHIGRCALLFQSICSNVSGGHQLKVYHMAIEQAILASAST